MLILTLRTDKPEAELGLFDNHARLNQLTWQAHRELAATIHSKLFELLQDRDLTELQAIAAYQGPGSFTGLRIGLSVANALADSLKIPIVAGSSEDWVKQSVERLLAGENDKLILPEYGAPVKTTPPRK